MNRQNLTKQNLVKHLFDDLIQIAAFHDNVVVAHTWKEVVDALDQSKLFMAPFCGAEDCEDEIKELSKADVEVIMNFD